MNALSKDIGIVIEYEHQESIDEYKALQKLIRKLRSKNHGRNENWRQESGSNH